MKKFFLPIALLLVCNGVSAANLTYLVCNYANKPEEILNFTLDEANGKVTLYAELAKHETIFKAYFGPEVVSWTDSGMRTTINRVDLSFTQEFTVMNSKSKLVGSCQIKTPSNRKI